MTRPGSEVVIVGGGVIGLAVAYELLRAGRPVRVLERDRFGGGATDASAGMLAPVSEAETECADQVAFGQDSLARYPEFVAAVERDAAGRLCGHRRDGTLWVALNRDDRERLEHLAETLRLKALAFRRLDRDRVRELEPRLAAGVVCGLQVDGDHQVDPRALVAALLSAIERLGGRLERGVQVEGVETAGPRLGGLYGRRGASERWRLACEQVVLCAGAWSDELLHPLEPLRVRPVKGQLLRLRGERLLERVIRTPEVYLVPRGDGELLVGATVEEVGFDTTPTAGAVHDLLRHAREVLPDVYELALDEVCVGLRPARFDQRPRIGPTTVEGLFVAAGHYRGGVLQAPATAHYLARAIVDGVAPRALEPFLPPQRLATPDV